jgi:hypothetical protein
MGIEEDNSARDKPQLIQQRPDQGGKWACKHWMIISDYDAKKYGLEFFFK